MSEFSKTEEFAFRKYIRSIIRKTDKLTKTQKEITLYMVNLWFYHRSGPKPYIHPSNKQICKKIKCVRATVQSCKKHLRDIGVIVEIGHANFKGKRATRYVVDIDKMVQVFDRENCKNWASAFYKIGPQGSPKIGPCISNVETDDKSFKSDDGTNNVIYLGKVRV